MKILYAFAAFTLIFGATPSFTHGQMLESSIIISEINWAGSSTSNADEWIELYNTSSKAMDLSGWVLAGVASGGDALILEHGTVIESQSTLLISNYDFNPEKTTLSIQPNLTTSALALSNTELEVMLVNQDSIVIDDVLLEDTTNFGSSKPYASMERNLETLAWLTTSESINLLTEEQFGTPGIVTQVIEEAKEVEVIEESAIPPCSPEADKTSDQVIESSDNLDENPEVVEPAAQSTETPEQADSTAESGSEPEKKPEAFQAGTLIINEIVSDPEDGTEWIEILNTSGEKITLTDWQIMEGSGSLTTLPDEILDNEAFFVVENPSGNLNNAGDIIQLLDPSENIIDEIEYGTDHVSAPEKGESIALNSKGEWNITSFITKAAKNKFDSESDQVVEWSDGQEDLELESPDSVESKNESSAIDSKNSTEVKTVEIVAIATSSKAKETEVEKDQETQTTNATTRYGRCFQEIRSGWPASRSAPAIFNFSLGGFPCTGSQKIPVCPTDCF